jgi:hypothetical protein
MDQTQTDLPSKLENNTMATKFCLSPYITAEIPGSSLVPNLTIGDGQYYNGYYNAPLAPGSMYKIFARVVTKATDGVSIVESLTCP